MAATNVRPGHGKETRGRQDLRTISTPLHRQAAWNKGEAVAEERRRIASAKGAKAKETIRTIKEISSSIWEELCPKKR